MYDDTRSEVGSLDLSLSLTKKRRNLFDNLQRNDFKDFISAHPQSPEPNQQFNNSYFKPIPEINRVSMQNVPDRRTYQPQDTDNPMKERPKASEYIGDDRKDLKSDNAYM